MFNKKIGEIISVILISACSLVFATPKNTSAADDPNKDLVGEWSGVWSGGSFIDRWTIVIHEIMSEKGKVRMTLVVDHQDTGHEETEITAEFISDPVPTIMFTAWKRDFTAIFRKRAKKLDVSYDGYAGGVKMSTSFSMEKRPQLYTNVEELLNNNPLPEGKKSQAIKVAENDNTTIYLVRATEGAGLKPHFHASHDETVHVIRGSGQLLVDGKWVDLQPGSIHFNPLGKTHANRQIGDEPLIFISTFSPGMKDPDRHFVQ